MTESASIVNALSIDVEDYFQVAALAERIAPTEWDGQECRVEQNLDVILRMLAEHGAHATFFTLGWVAERYPQLVRRVVDGGHELASHGYAHQRASAQSPEAFLSDIRRAKAVLEDTGGTIVKGYRAPSFSIGEKNLWALDCIAEAGYLYSSSIYPVRHDHYGLPTYPRFAFAARSNLIEVPISTVRFLNRNWPAGGGGYFRLLPYGVSRWALNRVNSVDRKPAIFYFHPWELDPGQPRIAGLSFRSRFRHYVNLRKTQPRLRRLLADFRWGRADEVYLDLPNSYQSEARSSTQSGLVQKDGLR